MRTKTIYSKPQTCIESMWAERMLCNSVDGVGISDASEFDLIEKGGSWEL